MAKGAKSPLQTWEIDKPMKTYKIPASWRMYGVAEIEATSLDEAIKKAHSGPLPSNNAYMEDSFEVDLEVVESYNEELPFK